MKVLSSKISILSVFGFSFWKLALLIGLIFGISGNLFAQKTTPGLIKNFQKALSEGIYLGQAVTPGQTPTMLGQSCSLTIHHGTQSPRQFEFVARSEDKVIQGVLTEMQSQFMGGKIDRGILEMNFFNGGAFEPNSGREKRAFDDSKPIISYRLELRGSNQGGAILYATQGNGEQTDTIIRCRLSSEKLPSKLASNKEFFYFKKE